MCLDQLVILHRFGNKEDFLSFFFFTSCEETIHQLTKELPGAIRAPKRMVMLKLKHPLMFCENVKTSRCFFATLLLTPHFIIVPTRTYNTA